MTRQLFTTLQKQIPDPQARIRALLAWYAATASTFRESESDTVIAGMLLLHDLRDLVAVIETLRLNGAEASGAARLVAMHGGHGSPRPLAATLSDAARNFLTIHTTHSGLGSHRAGNVADCWGLSVTTIRSRHCPKNAGSC